AGKVHSTHEGRPLWVRYDLDKIRAAVDPDDFLSKERFRRHGPTFWRYRELLPLPSEAPEMRLGETMTPLLRCRRLGDDLGLSHLYIKDESQLPTGSFKSRGMAVAVSMAKHLGLKRLAIPTAGNAGGALAAYGARAGLEIFVFMPDGPPFINQMEASLARAQVFPVNGLMPDRG